MPSFSYFRSIGALRLYCLFFLLTVSAKLVAQNSTLINFGGNTCSASYLPSFSMIKDPLTTSPLLLSNCDMQLQLPNYFSVFIAYNPKTNLVYIADIRSGVETKIWVLDAGLPYSIGCPATIPASPTYTYSYVSNNFEFDNNGDLWSFSNYDINTGQCSLDKFDVNTGLVINSRTLQFPAGNFPTSIFSGDLCILPNGRMFATLGSGPSQLYEITNYNGTGAASANFLAYIPRDCYGIAYLNGKLEIAGNDFNQSCYYFDYDISTGVLGAEKPFQVNNAPIDNTSFTPSMGCSKKLLGARQVNSNTYDLSYEVYVKNMGNVILTNIGLNDDLSATFGAGNVSSVSASFAPGFNNAGLLVNPNYNGVTNTNLILPNQNLNNQVGSNIDYYFKIIINCRATNLQPNVTYLNSAYCTGEVGNANPSTLIAVSDTSNNGSQEVVDPNQNGNANEEDENIPTPFSLAILPVHFLDVSAKYVSNNDALIKWYVTTPIVNGHDFTVQYSMDGKNWQDLSMLPITDNLKGAYSQMHYNVPTGNLLYRIRQTDNDGNFVISKIVMLRKTAEENHFVIYPNPADNQVAVISDQLLTAKTTVRIYDATGRSILQVPFSSQSISIPTEQLAGGTYLMSIENNSNKTIRKFVVSHH